jgi:tetratricopeptide (TPR) repeat protein
VRRPLRHRQRHLLHVLDVAEAEALARRLNDAEMADPAAKEYQGTTILAQLLKRNNKGQEAMDVIAKARQKAPKNLDLEVMELVLQGKINDANKLIVEDRAKGDPVLTAINTANLLADQGKGEEAMAALRAEEQRTPNNLQLLEAIFQLALTENKLDVAEQFGAKLERANADQSGGLSYRARLKLARRDLEGALRDATELARTDTRAGTYVILGQVQFEMGQADAAVVSYQKALDRQSDNYEALKGIVESYLALNQINSAEEFVRQGMRQQRLAVFFQEVQRRIIEHHRDPRLVTRDREEAIKRNPDVPRGYVALAENQIKAANWLIKNQNDAAGIKEAEASMNRAAETLKTAVERWPDDIVLVGRLAEMYLRLEKPDQAVAALEALAGRERWKDAPEPHQLLANLYLRTGKAEAAVKANKEMETALAKSKNSFAVRQQMVTFYLQTGQVERGIELLKKLIGERDDRQLRTQLIEVLVQVRRYDEADALVGAVLAKEPADARMLAMRGLVRMSQGKAREAGESIDAALKVDPNYAPALYYRGLLRLRTNDLAAAVEDLSRARDLSPTNVEMRLTLADALKRRGQLEESTKELEVALRASPTRREVRQRLFDVYFADKRWVALEKVVDDAKNNPDLAGDPTWRKAESQMWLARDNPEKAMAAIKVASRLAPGDPEVDYQFLEILQRMKDYEEVLKVTDQVIAKYQAKPWWMYLQRGLALDALKRTGEAEVALDAAMSAADQNGDSIAANRISIALEKVIGSERTIAKLEPRAKPYWALEIASMRLQRGEWAKAVEVADQVLQKEYERLSATQRLRALTLAGQIYTSSMATIEGSLEKAEQAYVRFLSETEKQGTGLNSQLQALNNLAFLFSDHPTKPNPQRALGYSRRAYDLMQQANTYDVSVADTHGWVLILNDRTDEGMEVLKTALSKKPLPDTHYHLGEAYLRKAQYSEAQSQFDQAAALLKQTKDRGGFVDPALSDKLARAVERLKQSNKSANAGN